MSSTSLNSPSSPSRLANSSISSGTRVQLPARRISGRTLFLLRLSYSSIVGVFPSSRTTPAQPRNRVFSCTSYPAPRASIPQAASAFTWVPKVFRISYLLMLLCFRSSVLLGVCPSLAAHSLIAAITSSFVTIFAPLKGLWHRPRPPVQAQLWLSWVEARLPVRFWARRGKDTPAFNLLSL